MSNIKIRLYVKLIKSASVGYKKGKIRLFFSIILQSIQNVPQEMQSKPMPLHQPMRCHLQNILPNSM